MIVPKLEKSSRSREYFTYDDSEHAAVVRQYLFDGKSHRRLDGDVLGLDPESSKGWQSMGILHFLGLKGNFKGLFSELTIDQAVAELKNSTNDDYSEIITLLSGAYEAEDEQLTEDIESETAECYEVQEEGKKVQYYTTRYERKPKNRKAAIKIHGTRFMACGFDFEKVYGERGKDYIEVHHVVPLADRDEIVDIDPAKDLIVVCANCHRMIHRKKNEILSLEELKAIIG